MTNINMQPRLYESVPYESGQPDAYEAARIARLKTLQNRIANRPETFQAVFVSLGEDASAETLSLKDENVLTQEANRDPENLIKEYFAKRDDTALMLDDDSEDAIFTSTTFKELAKKSSEKKAILKRKGVMGSVLESDPDALEASNAVRRHIFGEYLGRAVLWHEQQQSRNSRKRAS